MVQIRKALPDDSKIISLFQENMAMETEKIILKGSILQEGVKAVFSDASKGCYYIAEVEGKVVGCLLITYEWSDWRNGQIVWIQSVYVIPGYRRKGVFKLLYNYIKQIVENDPHYKGIRLYVDKSNENALKVYQRLGMDGNHYQLFEWINTSE